MRGRSIRALLALPLAALSVGCQVPTYHLPAGFSSTYQRQLYGMEPANVAVPEQGLAAIETRPGIFYPRSVYRESPAETREARGEPIEPLFLGSDPLTSQKVARDTTPDAS
jgi:hypothetical protein